MRGHNVEFADYREYCPGDDIGDVDWKAFGRTDRLFVRLFEMQTDMVVYLMLDCSASMKYAGMEGKGHGPYPPVSKLQYACHLLAAMAFLIVKQGDKVALGLFRERLDDYVPPGGTFPHLYGLLNRLERLEGSGRTNVAAALRQAFAATKRRGLLVVISDFLEDPAALFETLNLYRHRKFEIILFHVLHEEEYRLPTADNVRFIDSETHDAITTRIHEVRADYELCLGRHLEALRMGCTARRADYNLVTTSADYRSVLERYLVGRSGAHT